MTLTHVTNEHDVELGRLIAGQFGSVQFNGWLYFFAKTLVLNFSF